jgi:hypothetical protein
VRRETLVEVLGDDVTHAEISGDQGLDWIQVGEGAAHRGADHLEQLRRRC